MTDKMPSWPGWETVRLIGRGASGIVYEIKKTDTVGEFHSALKVISIPKSPEEFGLYEDDGYSEEATRAIFRSQVDEIIKEIQVMSQFRGTANIVNCEDHEIIPHGDGRGWDILIRMELVQPLPEYVKKNPITEEMVTALGVDICSALEMCEAQSIIHRDIKPQNIFINRFGSYKLGDFGIAKAMDHTTRATKAGTYSYMAPEVYNNRPYNATVDLYSLALVMYWLLNERRLPFLPLPPQEPTATQHNDALLRRLSGEPVPEPKNGSDKIKNIVLKALSYDPADRYATAAEMKAALLNNRGIPFDDMTDSEDAEWIEEDDFDSAYETSVEETEEDSGRFVESGDIPDDEGEGIPYNKKNLNLIIGLIAILIIISLAYVSRMLFGISMGLIPTVCVAIMVIFIIIYSLKKQ